eukprot:747806-Hanusia_phi.AAC.1
MKEMRRPIFKELLYDLEPFEEDFSKTVGFRCARTNLTKSTGKLKFDDEHELMRKYEEKKKVDSATTSVVLSLTELQEYFEDEGKEGQHEEVRKYWQEQEERCIQNYS